MFEGDLNFKDLDEIKIELQKLKNINFDTVQKCSKILENLDSEYSSYIEKFKLQILKLKYQKLRRADKINKEIRKDLSSVDARYLSQKSKENLIEFQNLLADLGELWIFDIQNSLKMRKINLQKIKDILVSQEQIICEHIASKDDNKRKILYKQFLKNESELHKIYGQSRLSFLQQVDINTIKHTANSILNDSQNILSLIAKNLQTTFWLCVFFGACFCIPYFSSIDKIPQINLSDIVYLLFGINLLAFLYIGFIIIFLMAYSYAIFKNNTKNKLINSIFCIMQIYILAICCLPFAYDIESLKEICEVILKNFNLTILGYSLLFAIYFGFGICKTKSYKDPINWSALFIAILFDILFIIFIYKRYHDINFFLLIYVFYFFVVIKSIAFLKSSEYKIIFYFSTLIGFMAMIPLSQDFVRIAKIANYKDDFTIKNEFINKDFLTKIPICLKNYDEACVDEKMSDEDKTTINNLLVKVKFDDRYYFIANLPKDEFNITKEHIKKDKDENLTDTSQRMFEIFKVGSCEQNPDIPCYSENIQENNITVKNYYKGFENRQNKNNKFFIEFKVKKENILN